MNRQLAIIPAQAVEIEKAILTNMLLEGATLVSELSQQLKPELFYKDQNSQLYQIILKLYRTNQTIDMLTVSNEAAKYEGLDMYVIDIVTNNPQTAISSQSNKDYVRILKEKYIRRKALETVLKMQSKIQNPEIHDEEVFTVLETAYQQINEIVNSTSQLPSFAEVVQLSYQKLNKRIADYRSGKLPGITTGLTYLNELTSGFQPGDLIVLAARPGMGKTAIALHFTKTAARAGYPVLFFSLEMANYRLADRIILGETQISSKSYRKGSINEQDNEKFMQHASDLSELNIIIDEKGSPTIDYLVATSRIAVRKQDVKMIIIDYLQLMDMQDKAGQTRDQAIGLVTRKLKQLAKELEVPIILLSQLNRSLEGRSNKVPTLADLRESGNIEQDADIVFLLFRPAYYSIPEYNEVNSENMLWIITGKFREGESRDIGIQHNYNLTRFEDYTSRDSGFSKPSEVPF